MINAIAEIGRFEKANNPGMTSFDIWLEDSCDNGKYPNLFVIEMSKDGSECVFEGVDSRRNSAGLKGKLLYKRGSSRGCDRTPTCKVAKSIEGTFRQKVMKWFEHGQDKDFLGEMEKAFLKNVRKELDEKADCIVSALKERVGRLEDGGGGIVLSPVFVEDGVAKFIGEFDFFTRFITEETKASYSYSKAFRKKSSSRDGICSICDARKPEVFGFFTSLAFYTIDKPGMVTGGFDQGRSWKNYPVCLDCALDVELGKRTMEQHLDFRFYGFRYHLIPKATSNVLKNDMVSEIVRFRKDPEAGSGKRRGRLTNAADDPFEMLADRGNDVTMNLLFYEKPQKGVLRILSLFEDVLPSRIKRLLDAKTLVDDICFFKDEKTKGGEAMYRFTFGVLRMFFPNNRIEGDFDKDFLELTRRIFTDSAVDYNFIVERIMLRIRPRFAKSEGIKFQMMQGLMLIVFLNELNLFTKKKRGNECMDGKFFDSFGIESKEDFGRKTDLFFKSFKEFFVEDSHCAIFLMGVLTQSLLNIELQKKDAVPFRNKLKGLKMDERDIVFLLPAIIEKMEQYKKRYAVNYQYMDLAELASKHLLAAGHYKRWNISTDEMNFIFVLGMNLSKYFRIKKKEGGGE